MKFTLADANGVLQDFNLVETGKNEVKIEMATREDVSAIIDQNKRAQNGPRQTMGSGTQTSMYKLGQLSALQAHELMKQGVFQDDKALRKWFDDLDNYLWRTAYKTRRGSDRCRTKSTK